MTTIAGAAIKVNNNNKHTYKILVVDDERDITSVIKKGLYLDRYTRKINFIHLQFNSN